MSIVLDTPETTRSTGPPAGFWIRLGAALVDFLVLLPAGLLILLVNAYMQNLVLVILLSLAIAAYKPLMEHYYGATLGKMACKLRVQNEDGTKLTMSAAWVRYLPWLIGSVFGLYVTYVIYQDPDFSRVDGYLSYVQLISQDADIARISRIQQWVGVLPLLSALVLLFNKPKQAAHDILADSYVVYRDPA